MRFLKNMEKTCCASFPLIEFNRHFFIENGQGTLVVDTGSPVSFHDEGFLELNGLRTEVAQSFQGKVDTRYIAEHVGKAVSGLLGMDFIGRWPVRIRSGRFGGVMTFGQTAPSEAALTQAREVSAGGFSVMGCPGITAEVNGRPARLLFDTGAALAYIDESFIGDAPSEGQQQDFSFLPELGIYTVDTYRLPCRFPVGPSAGHDRQSLQDLDVVFALPPEALAVGLKQMGIDGVIGYDLLAAFPVVLV